MYLKIGDRRTVYYVPYSHTTTLAAGDLAQGMNRLKKYYILMKSGTRNE